MSSSDPEEPDDDPFAGRLHRIVIPEFADVATIFGDDIDPSREPFADCGKRVAKIFGDDIDPSREPFADCGKLLPSGGSLDPGIWGGS